MLDLSTELRKNPPPSEFSLIDELLVDAEASSETPPRAETRDIESACVLCNELIKIVSAVPPLVISDTEGSAFDVDVNVIAEADVISKSPFATRLPLTVNLPVITVSPETARSPPREVSPPASTVRTVPAPPVICNAVTVEELVA